MRKMDVTEGIQVEIQERRGGGENFLAYHPTPILESITCPPNNNTAIPHIRQEKIYIYSFTQQPSFRAQSFCLMILGGWLMLYQSSPLELLVPIHNSIISRERQGKWMGLRGSK